MATILEHFYTIQGEGPNVGNPSYLIRFSKCTLKCPECDSKYSWKDNGINISEFDENIIPKQCKSVIITGGEPTMNLYPGDSDFVTLLKKIHYKCNKHVDIETNAIPHIKMLKDSNIYNNIHYFNIVTKGQDISYIVSPKFNLKSYPSKTPEGKNISVTMKDIFKFYKIKDKKTVGLKRTYYKIMYLESLKEIIKAFIRTNISDWFRDRIYIMPYSPIEKAYSNSFSIYNKSNYEKTIEFCKEMGVSYSPRVHIDAYGFEENKVIYEMGF